MSSLDPVVKNMLLISLLLGMSFVIFIILLVMTYRKRQTKLLIEKHLKESELKQIKLQSEIETLKAINKEKERISADIHDDMGGNVSSINFLSKLLQVENEDDLNQEHLRELHSQTLELSQKLRDIVWATKSENDTLDNLLVYVRQYCIKQLEPLGFIVSYLQPEAIEPIELKGEMRKDIFMSVKEVLNNIIKHSGAKKVKIVLSIQDPYLLIEINDDGKGLQDSAGNGNGMQQIQKRIRKYGGTVNFISQMGLLVSIQLKIK